MHIYTHTPHTLSRTLARARATVPSRALPLPRTNHPSSAASTPLSMIWLQHNSPPLTRIPNCAARVIAATYVTGVEITCRCVCESVCLSACLHVSVFRCVCWSTSLPVYPSTPLPLYLSTSLPHVSVFLVCIGVHAYMKSPACASVLVCARCVCVHVRARGVRAACLRPCACVGITSAHGHSPEPYTKFTQLLTY